MGKFKVGDKVIGNKLANKYGVTVEGWVGYVNLVVNDEQIRVDDCERDGGMLVGAECFDLYGAEPPKETPREFKVGDRVRVTEKGYREWENLREKGADFGTIIIYNNKLSIGIKFDKDIGGHDCGNKDCEYGHGWWLEEKDIELVKEEPKSEPTPTPVVNVNVTVNLYENACWYCRKGGLVDLYLAGVMGICPSCGRVCNNIIPTRF